MDVLSESDLKPYLFTIKTLQHSGCVGGSRRAVKRKLKRKLRDRVTDIGGKHLVWLMRNMLDRDTGDL